MKKSLISLAVAAVVAVPLSASAMEDNKSPWYDGTEVYGSLRAQFVSTDGVSITDGTSRWGVKGAHDLGNGLSGIYRMEYGINAADSKTGMTSRLGYVGLSGGFGTFALGEQWSPYYNAVVASSDLFISAGIPFSPSPFRLGNVFSYALPGGSPVSGAVAIVMNGSAGSDSVLIPGIDESGNVVGIEGTSPAADDDDIDAVDAGFNFAAGPVTLGIGIHDVEGAEDPLWGFSAAADFGGFGLIALIEDEGNRTPIAVTGTFSNFMLQYSDADGDVDGDDDDDDAITAGYNHKLGAKTKLQFAVEDNSTADDVKVVARLRVDF